ncbi:MAG: hypothetical protein UY36_C0009G0001 [Parcubacteria group bacterium GW2011_GWA1_49_11]|uniref:Uncharacterized protein n=1 Tax=Candidatus Yanofskybacteria bacterium RIFCSPHIGHO2_01_FULL_48_25b TaxID=1802672 RepID=A0A1F8F229_9BACT|nr:MAG: hypothetical protein UY36_C0009G0001 [Parcubacteria group bacterium GW2011_GWA1_49_11]OGN07185.1 MAG: hypothetical protein A2669_00375 [Candidatus Yanofskybacteria bacterium RIFCSPHIGHO2_01_FULL_48_25b]
MIREILNQFFIALYKLTTFPTDVNFAEAALNFQNGILDSTFVYKLQIIAAVIIVILTIGTVILSRKRKALKEKIAAQTQVLIETAEAGPLQDRWHDILRHIESVKEGEWKFAVIEADNLTDGILKNYFPGDTMGERLMNIDKTRLLSIENLWEAHKIRNRIAHDSNYFLRHAEAIRAIRMYESALRELGAIN